MTHEMKLRPSPFSAIREGRKTVEMRLYDEKRRRISVGDEILFTNNATGEEMTVRVLSLAVYASFGELYADFTKESLGYAEGDTADPTDMEEYYPMEKQKQYGVLAIGIERIDRL